jgi:hypothetical protein
MRGGARGGRGDPLDRGAERPGGVDPGPFGLRPQHAAATAQADRTAQLGQHRVPFDFRLFRRPVAGPVGGVQPGGEDIEPGPVRVARGGVEGRAHAGGR